MEQRHTSAFKPACPSCHEGTGRATKVTIAHGKRIIGYRCTACEHGWQQVDEADPPERLG